MASNKKITLDLNTKMKVIEGSEKENLSVNKLLAKYGVSKTQIYNMLKAKADIKEDWLKSNGPTKRNPRKTGKDELNQYVYEWFVSARSKNILISGPILQVQARKIAKVFGKSDFTASNGWLSCLRNIHHIVFNKICGETNVCEY